MGKRKRRNFTPEFKAEIVRLVDEGRPVSELSREHEIAREVIYNWVAAARSAESVALAPTTSSDAPLSKSEREELLRLRREKRELEMERDILKKAAAFFAKHST